MRERWVTAGAGLLAVLLVVAVATVVAAYLLDPSVTGVAPIEVADDPPSLNGAHETSYLRSVVVRLSSWVALLFVNAFGVVLPVAMLLGMWAARRRIIEDAGRHLRLLRDVAVGGFTVGLVGALPTALKDVGVWSPPPFEGLTDVAVLMLAWTTGLAGGLGYLAIFVLVAERFSRFGCVPGVVGAVSALGKRSLSGYLTHSIVMAPALSAWGLGLGAHLTSATMALFGASLWLATVVAAAVMERHGVRGPFEGCCDIWSTGRADRAGSRLGPERSPEGAVALAWAPWRGRGVPTGISRRGPMTSDGRAGEPQAPHDRHARRLRVWRHRRAPAGHPR
ncbi:MAG TPA: DUF418 domain-containing protein [Euzebyales bacterium]|nr:DUF418 domain-containing protein [Euzebyales bacterium]